MIEVNNLRHSYGAVEALSGVSFSIKPGVICGYLGPNGAGKSTTVKILTGILTPGSGDVAICGHDLAQNPLEAKRLIGYVPETAAAFSLLTIREYLECIGDLYEVEPTLLRDRIEALIENFSLESCANRRIDTLSKGQRQRTVLSAAMLHQPHALILDEPLTGLDANAARMVKDLLAGMAQRGCSILFCSHVLEIVERICHRVIVLHQGRIVADAPTAELTARAKDKTLESLFRELTCRPDEDESRAALLDALQPSKNRSFASSYSRPLSDSPPVGPPPSTHDSEKSHSQTKGKKA